MHIINVAIFKLNVVLSVINDVTTHYSDPKLICCVNKKPNKIMFIAMSSTSVEIPPTTTNCTQLSKFKAPTKCQCGSYERCLSDKRKHVLFSGLTAHYSLLFLLPFLYDSKLKTITSMCSLYLVFLNGT